MKFKIFTFLVFIVWCLFPDLTLAQNKVVVIPLTDEPAGPPAPVAKTGQTYTYTPGDDGDYQIGVPWPEPRFIDHGNGTVTDVLTGLIWLKEGNCDKFFSSDNSGKNERWWTDAISACNQLSSPYCGLTDDSETGYWRLPNINELLSLVVRKTWSPALSGPMRSSTQNAEYWTSTALVDPTDYKWYVNFLVGDVYRSNKDNNDYHVRCVHGGK